MKAAAACLPLVFHTWGGKVSFELIGVETRLMFMEHHKQKIKEGSGRSAEASTAFGGSNQVAQSPMVQMSDK